MAELGQQSMLDAPKPRSVIVPKGHGAWWGIDPSTRCVAIGMAIGAEELRVESAPFLGGFEGGQRLSLIYATTRELASRCAYMIGGQPGMVGVEQPSGSSQAVNHELEFAVGVIIAAVYDGVVAAGCAPPAMRLVVGSWWKVRSCGNGAARKTIKVPGRKRPVTMPFEDYEVLRWARVNGYAGSSWDEADAMGIAAAMRGDVDLVQR